MKHNHKRIGVFDSGLGGLTVLKQLQSKMPREDFVYFGDTAHVPYGNKSVNTIIKYCKEIIQFLIKKNVKIIVVACNTASSVALQAIKSSTTIPIIDVINPAINEIKNMNNIKNIGIIGTETTIHSKTYQKKIKKINNNFTIYSQTCPLFVPIIEEGLYNHKIASLVAELYLQKMTREIDALILGCTHYPIMLQTIKKHINKKTHIIDSAQATARYVKKYINHHNLSNSQTGLRKKNQYYVSDQVARFNEISNHFLDINIEKVYKAKL